MKRNRALQKAEPQIEYVQPLVDIYETPTGLVLEADLPGVVKDSVDVRVDQNTLTIEAQVKPLATDEGQTYEEFALANYHRCFRLPEDVDTQNISAELNLGVLRIHLPKAPETQPKKIEVRTATS